MERSPSKSSSREKLIVKGRKGVPWSAKEDRILATYVKFHGEGRWTEVARQTGLERSGKSCRLRWMNYLRPDIKRGNMSIEEEDLIIRLHKLIGNRWSLIARRLPGRTDNEIKNYWTTILTKKKKTVKPVPNEDPEHPIENSDSGTTSSTRDHVDMIHNEQLIGTCSKDDWVTQSMVTCNDITGRDLKFAPITTENGDHHGYDIHLAPKQDEYHIEKSDSTTSTQDHFDMINNELLIRTSTCNTNNFVIRSTATCDVITGCPNLTPTTTESVYLDHGHNDNLSWDFLYDFHNHAEQYCQLTDLINNFDFSNDFLLDWCYFGGQTI